MTVAELIAKLQEMPQNMEVALYDGDYGTHLPINVVMIEDADNSGLAHSEEFKGAQVVAIKR